MANTPYKMKSPTLMAGTKGAPIQNAYSPMQKESSYQRRIRERKEANKSSRGRITPSNAKMQLAELGAELKDRAVNTYAMSNLTNKAPAEIHSNIDRKTNKVKKTLRTLFEPKKKK